MRETACATAPLSVPGLEKVGCLWLELWVGVTEILGEGGRQ